MRKHPLVSRLSILSLISLFFPFAPALVFSEEAPPQQINLSRNYAIEMAIRRNIDLRIEALGSSMSETDYQKSWGMYNPVLGLNGSGGVTSTTGNPFFDTKSGTSTLSITQQLPTGGNIAASTQSGFTNAAISTTGTITSSWQSTVGLALNQPLLRNAGKEVAELNITLAANTLQDSLDRFRFITADTVLTVITTYNHLYTLRQVLDSRGKALGSAQKLLEEVKKKPQSSQQAMEVANAEYAVIQRRKDIVDAGKNVSDQEALMRYLIGVESETHLVSLDPPSREEPKVTETDALKGALENRLDLKQLYLALKTSQLQERVARHQSLPDLTVSASGGLSGTGGNFSESYRQIVDHGGTYWTVGLQFTYPLGNTTAENDYIRSKIRTEQARNQIKSLEWRIRNDVESDMRALISARIQMQMADKSLQIAQQRLEEYRKNNLAGTATVQDVINAENDLIFAQNGQMDATETFANGVAKLWRDMGVLLDRQGIHIETVQPKNILGTAKDSPPAPGPAPAPSSH